MTQLLDEVRLAESIIATFADLSNDEFVKVVRDSEKINSSLRSLIVWGDGVNRELSLRLLLKQL